MDSSRYPRYGQRIAPGSLAQVLNKPLPPWVRRRKLPPGMKRLGDMDERIWLTLDSDDCERIGEAVVQRVRCSIKHLPPETRDRHLPALPPGLLLDSLRLEARTRNGLLRVCADGTLGALAEHTIGTILLERGFGAKCLVDLLCCVESLASETAKCTQTSAGNEMNGVVKNRGPSSVLYHAAKTNSRYPRFGQRLSPMALRDVLAVPVPPRYANKPGLRRKLLSELDENIWTDTDPETCRGLARAIVKRVGARIDSLSDRVLQQRFPSPSDGFTLDDLGLELRTYNRLKAKFGVKLDRIDRCTIEEILNIPHFGAKCLVDLLVSLESVVPWMTHTTERSHLLDEKLTREANHVRRMRYADVVFADDPRLHCFFGYFDKSIRTARDMAEHLCCRKHDPPDPEALAGSLRRLRERVSDMSHMSLEEELKSIAVAATEGKADSRILDTVIKRFGWDGQGGCSLARAGEGLGVTRERVRQLCQEVTAALEANRLFAPILDRAIRIVRGFLPAPARDIEKALVSEVCAGDKFYLEGLLTSAEAMGRGRFAVIVGNGNKRLVIPAEAKEIIETAIQVAKRSIGRWGIAAIADVHAQLEGITNTTHDPAVVRALVSAEDGFVWLEEESGWFLLRSFVRNPILNLAKKALSVSPELDVSELRWAAGRHHRMKGFAPPRRILLALFGKLPEYRVDGDIIIATPPVERGDVLSRTETVIVQVLEEHGDVLDRESIEKRCASKGVSRESACKHLLSSPAITEYAPGVYGLTGANVSPSSADILTRNRKPGRVLRDYGRTSDGKIWLGYRLSRDAIVKGHLTVPGKMRNLAGGAFSLCSEDGAGVGTLECEGRTAKGLRQLFRRRGGDVGDFLVLVLDTQAREAKAYLGGPMLLNDFMVS